MDTQPQDPIFAKDFTIYNKENCTYSSLLVQDFDDFVTQKKAIFDIIYDNIYKTRYTYFLEVFFKSPEKLTYTQLCNILTNLYNFSLPHLKENPFFEFNIVFPQITKAESLLNRASSRVETIFVNKQLFASDKIPLETSQAKKQDVNSFVEHGLNYENYSIGLNQSISETKVKSFKRVCMGGTYDYMHSGHKVLLGCALLIATEHITLGITSNKMLGKKKNNSAIQCFQKRRESVHTYMTYFDPSVELNLVQIEDPVGPAKDQPFDVIIVTPETYSGGEYVNKVRKENGFSELGIVVADLVQDPKANKEAGASVKNDEKISSSGIREYIMTKIDNSSEKMEYLRDQWHELFKDLNIEATEFRDYWFDRVREKYVESWRYYHTLNHVYQLLKIIDEEKQHVEDLNMMRLIAWFHDVIYVPTSGLNEKESADFFEKFFESLNEEKSIEKPHSLTNEMALKVKKVIMYTANHMQKSEEIDKWNDAKFFLDIDLSILARPADEYMEYAKNIRKEYCHMNENSFREGRAKFMQKFVSGDLEPFRTDLFKEKYLAKCIENVKNEIKLLLA